MQQQFPLKKGAPCPRRASAIPAFSTPPIQKKPSPPPAIPSVVMNASIAPAAGPRCSGQSHDQGTQSGQRQEQSRPAAQQQPSYVQPTAHPHQHQPQQPRQSPRLSLPTEFRKKYVVKDELGVGGSGHIFSAVRKADGKEFAVKVIPSNRIPTNRWVADDEKFGGLVPTEVYIMAKLQHPSLIQFIDYFPGNGVHLIVMELFGSPWKDSPFNAEDDGVFPVSSSHPVRQKAMDLFELLEVRSLNEEDSHAIFTQIVGAVHFMLQNGLVHGDIKDENVLVDWSQSTSPSASSTSSSSSSTAPLPSNSRPRPQAKLIDFGATISLDPSILSTTHDFHGTLEFAPPEILLGHLYSPSVADAWSLGVLLYDMISKGAMPFDTPEDIVSPHVRPQPVQATAGCKDVLRGLLEKDPKRRMTVEQVVRHPWFTKGPKGGDKDVRGNV